VWFYDDNGITIDGPTALAYSDDVPKRFAAYGWHTITIDAHNMAEVESAIHEAHAVTDKPRPDHLQEHHRQGHAPSPGHARGA
jgi:transketolase